MHHNCRWHRFHPRTCVAAQTKGHLGVLAATRVVEPQPFRDVVQEEAEDPAGLCRRTGGCQETTRQEGRPWGMLLWRWLVRPSLSEGVSKFVRQVEARWAE